MNQKYRGCFFLLSVMALAALAVFSTCEKSKADAAVDQMLAAMAGTLDVRSQPYMNGGKLSGCTLVFDAIMQDWSYRQGGYLKVSGNVGFLQSGNNVGANLKVVVLEIDRNDPTLGLRPSPPSRAYIVDQNLQTNLASLQKSVPSDTPGALFSIFTISPTLDMIMDSLRTNELTIAFNSQGGGTDLQLELQLDVQQVTDSGERIRSDRTKSDFAKCLLAMGNRL